MVYITPHQKTMSSGVFTMSWTLHTYGEKRFGDTDIYAVLHHTWFPELEPFSCSGWISGGGEGYLYRDFQQSEWMGLYWSEDGIPRFGDPMVASF